jgi:RNA polymerase sigma factor (sigma-70 family)
VVRVVAKSKDVEFTDWLNARQSMLIKAARGICFDKQMAEDVLQEALADIYKRWEKISDHENLEAYAIRVILSKHADERRKVRRKHHDKDVSLETALDIADASDSPDKLAETLMVQAAIKSLTASQRAVLMLHYEYGFALREIGKLLSLPNGTVASHLARGKAAVATYVNFLPEIMAEDKKKISTNSRRELNYSEEEASE